MEISEPPKPRPTSWLTTSLIGASGHEFLQDQVVTGNAEQAEADDQHAGDGAALEGDVEGFDDARFGGFSGAHIGAHRDEHADEAGQAGEERTDGKADGGLGAETWQKGR